MRFLPLALLFALAVPLTAPAASAQTELGWDVLEAAEIVRAGDGWAVRHPTAAVRAEGQTVEVSGHMIPLETGRRVTRFAVSRMTAEECFYCQPGPMSFIEVIADRPVALTMDNITVVGRLALPTKGQRYRGGTIYRLEGARLTRSGLQ
ncbi:MAG: hypothetical protein AAF845_02625 [Bacteroidota bacterium]